MSLHYLLISSLDDHFTRVIYTYFYSIFFTYQDYSDWQSVEIVGRADLKVRAVVVASFVVTSAVESITA